MSKAGQTLLDGVDPRFRHHMFHACKDTKFSLAQLGNDAGIYGCFRLANWNAARLFAMCQSGTRVIIEP